MAISRYSAAFRLFPRLPGAPESPPALTSSGGNEGPCTYSDRMVGARIGLLVVYCSDLPSCRDFYRSLGLVLARERHGSGPEHYAAVLDGGAVLELYPAGSGASTGRIRLGLTVKQDDVAVSLEPGNHVLRDPEGRVVDVHVIT